MVENKSHINVHPSAEELQKYVTGMMNSKERNQLEKHLLGCDLCSEAMEGLEKFVGKGGFVTDVELLKHKVTQKVISSNKGNRPYRDLGLAASVLILLSFGFYLFTLDYFSGKDSDRIAQNEPEETKEKVAKAIKNKSDTNIQESIEMESELSEDMEESEFINIDAPEIKALNRDEEIKEVVEDESNLNVAIMEEVVTPESPQLLIEKDETTSSSDLEGLITEEDRAEDSLESIAIRAKKSVVSSEVMVSAEKSERRNAAPELDQISSKAQPIVGMEAYKKYLEKEIKYPQAASDKKVKGSVSISFVVGESGDLVDVKVEKGLGYGCDEEALRLIVEGPKWIPEREDGQLVKKRQRIKIKFEE